MAGFPRIVRFNFDKDGLQARGHPINVPAGFHAMPANGGIARAGDEPQVIVASPDQPGGKEAGGEAEVEAQATRQMPRIEPDRRDEALRDGICPACHADIRSAEVYCPNCGRIL